MLRGRIAVIGGNCNRPLPTAAISPLYSASLCQLHQGTDDRRPKTQTPSWLVLLAALTFLGRPMQAQQSHTDVTDLELPTFIEGSAKLHNAQVRYTYHFNHSAVTDCVRSGNFLIALAKSGILLRFDATSLKLTGQQIVPGLATAIALDARGHVLIGTGTGEIAELDPATLEQRSIFTAQGRIKSLAAKGASSSGSRMIVAIVAGHYPEGLMPWPGETSEHFHVRSSQLVKQNQDAHDFVVVYRNGTEHSFVLEWGGDTFFVDDSERLWIGSSMGEWGGTCSYMSLQTGKIRKVTAEMPGVAGFLRSQDGRMLVYGGTNHGFDHGFIARIEGNTLKYIRKFDGQVRPVGPGLIAFPKPDRQSPVPQGTIDLMTADFGGHGFWVVSNNILYHANASLSGWNKTADFDYKWDEGRRYSADGEPTAKWLITDKSQPDDMILVMTRGGFVRISRGHAQPIPSRGQLEASLIGEIWMTSIGALFLEGDDLHSTWRRAGDRWQELNYFPRPAPSSSGYDWWHYVKPIGDDGRGIVAFVGDRSERVFAPGSSQPQTKSSERYLVMARPQETAKVTTTWQDTLGEDEMTFVMTSEGVLLRNAEGKLWRWGSAGWHEVGSTDVLHRGQVSDSNVYRNDFFGRRFVSLARIGSTEVFLDSVLGEFVRLVRKPDGTFEFGAAEDVKHRGPGFIFDAVADEQGWVLAAAGPGLFRFRPEDGELLPISGPKGSKEIISLCRDDQGRLWAASRNHLYVSSDEGTDWELLDLPLLPYTETAHVRRDSEKRHGVVFATSYGVIFLDW
jgi:hypothetical protein